MSRARLSFFIGLCLVAGVWATTALWAQYVRMDHRAMLLTIPVDETSLDRADLEEAIADYTRVMRVVRCHTALHHDRLVLLAKRADMAMTAADVNAMDAPLQATQHALAALLACTPHDGKAWLDLATMTTLREGFTDRALIAYQMSARVAPGESWLAQKRVMFALTFYPLFDAKAKTIARADLAVLERAHPNRLTAIVKQSQLESKAALYERFDATLPTP